jgi:hypothetical protein
VSPPGAREMPSTKPGSPSMKTCQAVDRTAHFVGKSRCRGEPHCFCMQCYKPAIALTSWLPALGPASQRRCTRRPNVSATRTYDSSSADRSALVLLRYRETSLKRGREPCMPVCMPARL